MKKLKKIVILSLSVLISVSCLNACNNQNAADKSPVPSIDNNGAGSGSVVITGGTILGEKDNSSQNNYKSDVNIYEKSTKNKPVTVIDETGKKCNLKLNRRSIDFKDVGICTTKCSVGNVVWNQVYRNDFYYVRYEEIEIGSGKEHKYFLYKNHGEKVGEFNLTGEDFSGGFSNIYMCIYKNRFYVVIDLFDYKDIVKKIGYIDLKQKNTVILYNVSRVDNHKTNEVYQANFDDYMPYTFYEGKIYFGGQDKNFVAGLISISSNKKSEAKKIADLKPLKADSNWFFMDHKIYYGIEKGKKVNLYCFDLVSNARKKILSYNRNTKSKEFRFEMDDTYIYSQEFIIPLKGGKMVKKDVYDSTFVHNDKYIFYIDSNYKLHRVNKENLQKDTIISKSKFWSVYCTDNELYLKKYNKEILDWLDDEDDDTISVEFGITIYIMDFNGRKIMDNYDSFSDE